MDQMKNLYSACSYISKCYLHQLTSLGHHHYDLLTKLNTNMLFCTLNVKSTCDKTI